MEIALWKKQLIYASKINKSYDLEKSIREASAKEELRCIDKDCDSPILIYCHGNKKRPYFSHKHAHNCDYVKYNNNNSNLIKDIQLIIFDHLNKKSIQSDIDKKIFDHHYTHIFISTNNMNLALELVTDSTRLTKINKLSEQYKKYNIPVQFIIIGENFSSQSENDYNFIRRFSLNETTNNNLLVINKQGYELYQYRHKPLTVTNCQTNFSTTANIYHEKDVINSLTFENGYLTICGFNNRYNNWLLGNPNIKQKYITIDNIFISSKSKTEENPILKNNIDLKVKETPISNHNKTKNTYKTEQIKTIDELKFIETISLPANHTKTELYNWSELDFINNINKVCYESNTIAFKHIIIKMKNHTEEEKNIIVKLWKEYKTTRSDYFYILKTARDKSGIKQNN